VFGVAAGKMNVTQLIWLTLAWAHAEFLLLCWK
jgi:hypothetical protein